MTTMTKTTSQPIVSLNLPATATALISYANVVLQKTTNNPSLPSPTPTLAAIQTAVAALQAAETTARTRVTGAATAAREKRLALAALLKQLASYIQATANASGADAASVIESAGVHVRKIPTHHARVFAAKQGPVSGAATIVAPSAGLRSSFEWQYSTDGGKTWVTAPPTVQAKTTVSGPPTAAITEFKYRAVTNDGAGDWSAAVALLVQ
jgi:hypothetical protein